jgi:predicted ATP-grasp superfamily ATP-dependent carboligase
MRLLVTNTRTGQAYAIIRCLRPHAEWISATMYGSNWLTAQTAAAAWSRMVNRRYVVTSPEEDWAAGKIQQENTKREERYMADIERICQRDRIDTIFPSYDPQVYILAKNRQRLAAQGVEVLTPDSRTLSVLLDKSKTLKLAEKVGFPHPRTYRVDEYALEELSELVEPPWVVRPVHSARSRGMAVVWKREDLEPTVARLQENHRDLILQEYIPGTLKQNFYMLMGKNHEVLSLVAPKVLRTSHRIYRNSSAAVLFNHEHEYNERVIEMVSALKWTGGLTVQTKIDSRDGTPKLMEINPRMGSHTWYSTEMGINLPLMQLRSFQGETLEPVKDYPNEAIMLEPFEDFIGLIFIVADRIAFTFRRLLGRKKTDSGDIPVGVFEMINTLRKDYFGPHKKAYMPQFRYALSDPMVFIMKSWAVLRYELSQIRRAGI